MKEETTAIWPMQISDFLGQSTKEMATISSSYRTSAWAPVTFFPEGNINKNFVIFCLVLQKFLNYFEVNIISFMNTSCKWFIFIFLLNKNKCVSSPMDRTHVRVRLASTQAICIAIR